MTETLWTVLIIALALVACVALVALSALRLFNRQLDANVKAATRKADNDGALFSGAIAAMTAYAKTQEPAPTNETDALPDLTNDLLNQIANDPEAWMSSRASGAPGPATHQEIRRSSRVHLPMSSEIKIKPNTSAQITARPQRVNFRPLRILIGGDPSHWIVNDVKVGNTSQFAQSGDVPGEMFAMNAVNASIAMDEVGCASDFVMQITYVGDDEDGAAFSCTVVGEEIRDTLRTTPDDAARRMILPMSSGINIMPNKSAQITARPQKRSIRPDCLVIGGNPKNWVVNSVKVGNQPQFANDGNIPGEAFAYDVVDMSVDMDTIRVAMDFVIQVTYVGDHADGEQFLCAAVGNAT